MRVSCCGVGVSFGAVEALSDVSFETHEREFVGIVGPSGCGKTTLLRVLAGSLQPQRGAVLRSPSVPGNRVLLVFQENNLFPWMTVLENAAFGLEMQGWPRKQRESRAREQLERFGLGGREDAYPGQLSLGMKQRVAVIRSFLSDPAMLLMDEPFSALDVQTRMTLQQELLGLWEQSDNSVVFVTHDVEEAILLSDRVLVLGPAPGTIVAEHRVRFPRPRPSALTLEEDFLQFKREIWSDLGLESRAWTVAL